MTKARLPWTAVPRGLRVVVRLTPRARRAALGPVVTLVDGRPALKAAVMAPPVDGAANAALVKLLAKSWRLPASAVTIAAGATGRTKVVAVAGDPAALAAHLAEWLAARDWGTAE